MPPTISQNLILILAVLAAVNIAVFLWLLIWRSKLKALLKGAKGDSLEKIMQGQDREIKRLKNQIDSLTQETKNLTGHTLNSIQKVGLVKFNPFNEASANQSFTIAMLNHKDDGFILSNLASRDGTRLYAKEIAGGKTKYNLSKEEQSALKQALKVSPAGSKNILSL